MRYTQGVELKGDMWDRLAEFQIDKVAVQNDMPAKQLEDEGIVGEERDRNFRESWAEFWKDAKVADLRRQIRRNGPRWTRMSGER